MNLNLGLSVFVVVVDYAAEMCRLSLFVSGFVLCDCLLILTFPDVNK